MGEWSLSHSPQLGWVSPLNNLSATDSTITNSTVAPCSRVDWSGIQICLIVLNFTFSDNSAAQVEFSCCLQSSSACFKSTLRDGGLRMEEGEEKDG